jgi:flagellar biosynthesis regulator FlbT
VEGFVLAKDLQSAIDFVKMAYLEGYPLNLHRAQAIAGAVERGQRRIGVELVREMIRQKMSLHGTNKTKSILSILLSSQGIALGKDNSARSQFVARLSAELEEMIVSVKEAKDIEDALNEIDRILGVQDKEVV